MVGELVAYLSPYEHSPFLRRFARTHPWAVRGLLLWFVAWVGTCFALGYRLPWFDRHPSWSEFPTLTNPRLAVEEIPDSVFARQYGHRFPYPEEADSTGRQLEFYDDYPTNLRKCPFRRLSADQKYITPQPGLLTLERSRRPGCLQDALAKWFYSYGYEY